MDNQNIIRKMTNIFRAFSFVILLTVLTACSSPTPQPVGTALLGIEQTHRYPGSDFDARAKRDG